MSAPTPTQPQKFRLMVGESLILTSTPVAWNWPNSAPTTNPRADGWPPIEPAPTIGQTWPNPSWSTSDAAVCTATPIASSTKCTVSAVAVGHVMITATVLSTTQQFFIDVVAATPEWLAITAARS